MERQVEDALRNIKGRLERGKVVRDLSGNPMRLEEKILKAIFDMPTNVARQETVIDVFEQELVEDKLNKIYGWVMQNGAMASDLTESLDYESPDKKYSLAAYPNDSDNKLLFVCAEADVEAEFWLKRHSIYSLEIGFIEPENRKYSYKYKSGTRQLAEMNREEFEIVLGLADEFISTTEIIANSS